MGGKPFALITVRSKRRGNPNLSHRITCLLPTRFAHSRQKCPNLPRTGKSFLEFNTVLTERNEERKYREGRTCAYAGRVRLDISKRSHLCCCLDGLDAAALGWPPCVLLNTLRGFWLVRGFFGIDVETLRMDYARLGACHARSTKAGACVTRGGGEVAALNTTWAWKSASRCVEICSITAGGNTISSARKAYAWGRAMLRMLVRLSHRGISTVSK